MLRQQKIKLPKIKKTYTLKDSQEVLVTFKALIAALNADLRSQKSEHALLDYYDLLSGKKIFSQILTVDPISYVEMKLLLAETMIKMHSHEGVLMLCMNAMIATKQTDIANMTRIADCIKIVLAQNKEHKYSEPTTVLKKPTSPDNCKIFFDLGNGFLQKTQILKATQYYQTLSESPFFKPFFLNLTTAAQTQMIETLFRNITDTFQKSLKYDVTDVINLVSSGINIFKQYIEWSNKDTVNLQTLYKIRSILYLAAGNLTLAEEDSVIVPKLSHADTSKKDKQMDEVGARHQAIKDLLSEKKTTENHLKQAQDYLNYLEEIALDTAGQCYVEAIFFAARLSTNLGHYQLASKIYTQALNNMRTYIQSQPQLQNKDDHYSDYFKFLLLRADTYNLLQNFDAAIADCNQMLLHSKSLNITEDAESANHLKTVIIINMIDDFMDKKSTHRITTAESIKILEKILSLSIGTNIEKHRINQCHIELAYAYQDQKNYPKALTHYTAAIYHRKKLDVKTIMLHLERGLAYLLSTTPNNASLAFADFNTVINHQRLSSLLKKPDGLNLFKTKILEIINNLIVTHDKKSLKIILKLTEPMLDVSDHLFPLEAANLFLTRAKAYYGLNHPTLALEECNKALEKFELSTTDYRAAKDFKRKIQTLITKDQHIRSKTSSQETMVDPSNFKNQPLDDTKPQDINLFRDKVKILLESKNINPDKLRLDALGLKIMANDLIKRQDAKAQPSIISDKKKLSTFIKKIDQVTHIQNMKIAQKQQRDAAHKKRLASQKKFQDEIQNILAQVKMQKTTVETSIRDSKEIPAALLAEVAKIKFAIQQLSQASLATLHKKNKHKKFNKIFPELSAAQSILNETEDFIENALYEKEQKSIDAELQHEMEETGKSITDIEIATKSVVDRIHKLKPTILKITSLKDFTEIKMVIKHHILEANIVNDNATALLYQANEVGDPNLQQRAKMCVKETEAALLKAKENQNSLYKLKFTDDKETIPIKQTTTIPSTLTSSLSIVGALSVPIKDEGEQRFQDFFLNQMFPPSANDNKVTYLESFSNMKFQTEFEWINQLRSELAQHGITLILRCSAVPIAINHNLKSEMKGTTQTINDIDFYISYSKDIDPVLLNRTLREFRFNPKKERPNEFFQNFSCKRKRADGTEITYEITWVTSPDYKSTNPSILKRQNMLIKPTDQAVGDENKGSIHPINNAFSAVLLFYKNQPELEMLLKTENYEIEIPDPKDPYLRNFLQRTIKDYEWSQTVLQLKGIGPHANKVLTDYKWIKDFFATKHADTYLKPGCYLEIIALLTSGYLTRTSAALHLKAFLSVVMEAHFNKFFPGVYTAHDLDSAAQNMLPFFQNIFSNNLPTTKDEIATKFYFATKYAIELSNYFSNGSLPSTTFSDFVRPECLFRRTFHQSAILYPTRALHLRNLEAGFRFEFTNELSTLLASPTSPLTPSDQKAQYDSTAADGLLALQMQTDLSENYHPIPDVKHSELYEELLRTAIPVTSGSSSSRKSTSSGSTPFWSSSSSSRSSQLSDSSSTSTPGIPFKSK